MEARLADGENPEPPAGHLITVAIGAVQDAPAPALAEAGKVGELVDDAGGEYEALRAHGLARCELHFESGWPRRCAHGLIWPELGRRIRQHLFPSGPENVGGRATILPEETVRGGSEAVPRPPVVDDEHAPARPRELHRSRKPRKAPAGYDHVEGIHGLT